MPDVSIDFTETMDDVNKNQTYNKILIRVILLNFMMSAKTSIVYLLG